MDELIRKLVVPNVIKGVGSLTLIKDRQVQGSEPPCTPTVFPGNSLKKKKTLLRDI